MVTLPRIRRTVLLLAVLAAGLVTVLAVAIGMSLGGGDPAPTERPQAAPDSLRDLDTEAITITRESFCERMPDEAPATALAAEPDDAEAYDNGERAALTGRVTDVAHEYGCRWSTAEADARGWVFAPPVTRAQARDFARSARDERGCRRWSDAPTYGGTSVALVCTRGDTRTVTLRGLFGDAWLACSLSAPESSPEAELTERGEQWCADVVQAARV